MTALQMLGGTGAVASSADGQAELFGFDHDAPMPLPPAPEPKRDGPGRPKGARNRSTEQWREYFLSRYQSPLMALGAIYTRRPEDLARELGLTREVEFVPPGFEVLHTIPERWSVGEASRMLTPKRFVVWDVERAFQLQMRALEECNPYLHQKQPLAIDNKSGGPVGIMMLGDMSAWQLGETDNASLPLPPEQNQQVIDLEPVKSDAEKSEAQPKSMNGHGKNGHAA